MKKLKTVLSLTLICVLTFGGMVLLTGCKDKSDLFSSPYSVGGLTLSYEGSTFSSSTSALGISYTIKNDNINSMTVNADCFTIKIINDNVSGAYVYIKNGTNYVISKTCDSQTFSIAANSTSIYTFTTFLYNGSHTLEKSLSSNIEFELIYLGNVIARFKPTIL